MPGRILEILEIPRKNKQKTFAFSSDPATLHPCRNPAFKPQNETNMSNATTIYNNSSLGVKIPLVVPATVAGLIAMASERDVHNAVIAHSCHQGWNVALRKAVTEFYEATFPRNQKVVGGQPQFTGSGDKKKPALEEPGAYFNRLKSEGLVSEAQFEVDVRRIAATIDFKVKKAEEESTPDDEYYIAARQILAQAEAGTISPRTGRPVNEADFVENWTTLNPGHDFYALGGWTEDGLARAIEINTLRIKAQSVASLA